MTKILIIDNDSKTVTPLTEHLQQQGFVIEPHSTAKEGLDALLSNSFDLVILETQLPDKEGMELLLQVRQKSLSPILIVSNNDNDEYRISCLEMGVDDYIIKPALTREITARAKAILNRTQSSDNNSDIRIKTGALTINPHLHHATLSNSSLNLTGTEFNLLWVMAKNVGKVVSKNELSLVALKRPTGISDRCIDVHISSIRQKMHLYSTEKYIKTIRGEGYLLINKGI